MFLTLISLYSIYSILFFVLIIAALKANIRAGPFKALFVFANNLIQKLYNNIISLKHCQSTVIWIL